MKSLVESANHAIIRDGSRIENHPGNRRNQMNRHRRIRLARWVVLALVGSATLLPAQQPSPVSDAKTAASVPAAPRPKAQAEDQNGHRFWDKTNDGLFAGVGASRTLDYFSTLNMRRRGRQEILITNDAVDNHAAFAAIEAAATGVSLGVSYLFHRYGHHQLERWTSIVHIGLATTGAVRNYSLKTLHPAASAAAR